VNLLGPLELIEFFKPSPFQLRLPLKVLEPFNKVNVFLQFHGEFFKSNMNVKFYKPILAM